MDFNSYLQTDSTSNSNQNQNYQYYYNPTTNANQTMNYQQNMNYYYPYYYPQNINITPQGISYSTPMQQSQQFAPMMSNMNPQALMTQFAQFVSSMNSTGVINPPQSTQVIEGQKFPPPDSYTCNRCKQKGHWIQFCPLLKNKNEKKKKQAMIPSSQKIECKACNKWFISEEKKEEHMKKHEKCPYPDCTFSAIEKVLQDHIASVHQKSQSKIPPSLMELIPEKYRYVSTIGNNPDDIRKWREDRKRNYPTQENIEKKQALQETVEQAGALLQHEEKEIPKYTCISGKRVALCMDYLNDTCKQGSKCKLLHDPCRKNKQLCKAFTRGYCRKGSKCKKMHSPSDRLLWLKQNAVDPNIPSLLSQLLDNDVLNENSCILQCLQYIIDEELIPAPDSLKKKVVKESESEESESKSESESESESEESESEESESESESEESESESENENEGNNESENENNENKEKETNIITETNSNTPTNQEAIKTENSLSTIQEE